MYVQNKNKNEASVSFYVRTDKMTQSTYIVNYMILLITSELIF